jgi:hypothetical protein
VSEPLVYRQPDLREDLDAVSPVLTRAFGDVRKAVLAGRPVVLVLNDRDLLGQGTVIGAAVATGLLGLARAVALEGAKQGWRINLVTCSESVMEEALEDSIAWVGASPLSGQLLRVGTAHLGRVSP